MWDGNPIKLDCDDHCTTTNVINSLSSKRKKERKRERKKERKKEIKKERERREKELIHHFLFGE